MWQVDKSMWYNKMQNLGVEPSSSTYVGFMRAVVKDKGSQAGIELLSADIGSNKLENKHVDRAPKKHLYFLIYLIRGEAGKWIAFVAVVLRLFFPRHFPDWLEMSGSLILLLVLFKFKTLIVALLEEEVEEDHFVVEDKEEEMCQVKILAHSKEEEEELVEVTMEEEEVILLIFNAIIVIKLGI
ncbi:hypothetical protein POM88_043583 [Heracleum sosnowskyi]|uniref:Uncharacterized protein n=1 Tax=Heracleum sosnowskyi TaxID=360622 RepID=A0AAD8H2C5_9APIA|nr:hypothetical protein POM88_043583 [Heracleum sosnowskyi]